MTLGELEKRMKDKGIIAVNIHCDDGEFRVHVRDSIDVGFTCAQKRHSTIQSALREHFKSSTDLSDLLI